MASVYSYKARDRLGQELSGSIMAESEAAVAAYIRDKGLFVTRITAQKAISMEVLSRLVQPVRTKDLAIFCRQFATMADAGIALVICLKILLEQTDNPRFKACLQVIYKKVREGQALSMAMAAYPAIFPELMVSLIEAGEVGGVLGEMLNQLAVHFEKEHKLNEQIKSAMVYPAVVIGMAVLAVGFILLFVLPVFINMFNNLAYELPLPTRMLLAVSDFFTGYGLYLLVVLVLGGYGVVAMPRQHKYRLVIDKLCFVLPVFGKLWRKVAIVRFSRTLATLLTGGVPILTALEVAKKTLGNQQLIQVLTIAQNTVREGQGLAAPLGASKIFPPMVKQMLIIGEETGNLANMLERIAGFYDSEVEDSVKRLSSMLEPILIALVGIVIGFIVISVMLPMFEALSRLNSIG